MTMTGIRQGHPLRSAESSSDRPAAALSVTLEDALDDADWSDLEGRLRPEIRFLAAGWWQAWAKALLPHGNWRGPLRLLVARDHQGVVQAVLPLAEQIMAGITVQSLAGGYAPFRTLLIAETAPDDTAEALVAFLAEEIKPKAFRFGPVEANRPEIRALIKALKTKGWHFCLINSGEDHLLDLPDDLESYEATVPKKQRQRMNALRRRLDDQGEVQLRRYRGLEPAEWNRIFDQLALVERASWLASKGGDFTYADPGQAAFWRHYISDEAAAKALSVWVMSINDQPISFNVALDSGPCRYGLFCHYDEALKSFAPGNIVNRETIVTSFEDGLGHLNLGRGDSGNKARFGANRTEALEDWMTMPPTAAGRVLHLAACAKFRANIEKSAVRDA
ncbi:MAG: GNAT family N-acetyltransferase [Geminicoccaceae bacterium]